MGRFKGELGERTVALPLVNTTRSGIEVRKWAGQVANFLTMEGRNTGDLGPAICDTNGYVLSSSTINGVFLEALESVQERRPDLLPTVIKIREIYNIYRSLRRGATSRAKELEYDQGKTQKEKQAYPWVNFIGTFVNLL
jgi:hypothetical protein